MTTEEKANAYNKVLKKVKDLISRCKNDIDRRTMIYRVEDIESILSELAESEDDKIRKEIIDFLKLPHPQFVGKRDHEKWIAWIEKQGLKSNPYSGVSFNYNGNTWGMCARDNGVDILFNRKLMQHISDEKQDIFSKKDVDDAYLKGVRDTKNEIEKQYEANYQTRKDIATFIFNYRGDIKDRAKWMDYLGIKVSFVGEQGEQKPTDTVEPKFHEGDFIKHNKANIICKVISVNNGSYYVENIETNGRIVLFNAEQNFHLWTIQDAMDGDVLVADNRPFIYNGSKNEVTVGAYCGFNVKNKFSFAYNYVINRNITPATKEQRDLLFQKIKEAGYEWDAEKKELKVKPKFEVGDWLVHNERKHIVKVVNHTPLVYEVVNILGYHHTITDTAIENNYHLWTLEDAKDGDVLAVEDKNFITPFVAIYKERGLDFFNSHCFIGFDGNFYKGEEGHSTENIHLATTEQRDLLFQKMNEAGYEWDAEKKELKKIEQKLAENAKPQSSTPMSYGKELEKRMCEACDRFFAPNTDSNRYSASDLFYAGVKAERDLNTLAWSEEDEKMMAAIEHHLNNCGASIASILWLKSLKDRVGCEANCTTTKEWSEEGEGYFDTLIGIMNERMNCSDEGSMVYNVYKKAQDWLKSLKCRVQPKQEWSEEDEEMLNSTILFVEHSAVTTIGKEKGNVISWLKSLRPQNTWKPSDEQIKAIRLARAFVTDDFSENPTLSDVLVELEEQLKKLKE